MAYYPRLFSTDSAKAAKASGFGYLNAIHYMAPHTLGGHGNLCSHASKPCIALCLGHYSGQAGMVSDLELDTNPTRESRKLKAKLFMTQRGDYMNRLARDIVKVVRDAQRDTSGFVVTHGLPLGAGLESEFRILRHGALALAA